MAAIIRQPTVRELNSAQKFSNEYYCCEKLGSIVKEAEVRGYSLIPRQDKPLILLPSGEVLDWDWNPRSLDTLAKPGENFNPNSPISIAGLYSGIVYEHYLKRAYQ